MSLQLPIRLFAAFAIMLCSSCTVMPTKQTPLQSSTPVASQGSPVTDEQHLRELLLDAWVTDGRTGFFLDDAWSTRRSPFSLYDTRWSLQLFGAADEGKPRLAPESVKRWLHVAEVGQLLGSPLPAIAQISYAVGIAQAVGATTDKVRVGAVLETLRSGGQYRTASQTNASWGSTALAVETLRALDLSVPDDVVRSLRGAIGREPAQPSPHWAVEDLVPILRAVADLDGLGLDKEFLAQRTHYALRALGEIPDAVWLGAQASLRRAARDMEITLPAISQASCSRLLDADKMIGLPGGNGPDLQLTFQAKFAGCTGVAAPPMQAHSRAGWPHPHAGYDSIRATSAGLSLAKAIGFKSVEFSDAASKWISDFWLSSRVETKPASKIERLLTTTRLKSAAVMSGWPNVVYGLENALLDVPVEAADDIILLVILVYISHLPPDDRKNDALERVKNALTATDHATIFAAAAKELLARLLNAPEMHMAAQSIVTTLRLSNGLYALDPAAPGSSTSLDHGSMTATVLAAWIDSEAIPVSFWEKVGLCHLGQCGDNLKDATAQGGTPLWVVALARSCLARGCSEPLLVLL